MARTLSNIFIIISAGKSIIGISGIGFIVLVNCIDWSRSRKYFLIDVILTCLAISRILLCIVILDIGFNAIYEKIFNSNNLVISFVLLWTGLNYFCITCSTCLCVFYFLKIATFSNPIFLWMKWRIQKVLLFIVLSATISFGLCFTLKNAIVNSLIKEQAKTESNLTWNFTVKKHNFLIFQVLSNMVFIIPFVVSLTCCVLSILSLWNHTKQMKGTGVHVRAMKSTLSFLLFFVMYYLSSSIMVWDYSFLDSVVAKIFADMLAFLYLSCHPFLLIWNSKLKQASLCILRNLKCCMNRKSVAVESILTHRDPIGQSRTAP